MNTRSMLLLLAALVLLTTFGLIQVASGQDGLPPDRPLAPVSETQDGNRREVVAPAAAVPDTPLISFIDSPTATCYQPDPARDECYINWYYMSVSASPSYIISMTAAINTYGIVASYHGFFQESMYAPFQLNGQGFQVPCGALGEAGNPLLGRAYPWTIRARASDGLKSANYGSVICPAFTP